MCDVFRASLTVLILLFASVVISTPAMADEYSVTFHAGCQTASGTFEYTPTTGFQSFNGRSNLRPYGTGEHPFFSNYYPFPICGHSGAALTFAELTSNDCAPYFNNGFIQLVGFGTSAEFHFTISASTGAFDLSTFEIQQFVNIRCCNYNNGSESFAPGNINSVVHVKDIQPLPEPGSLILLGTGVAALLPKKLKRAGRAFFSRHRPN